MDTKGIKLKWCKIISCIIIAVIVLLFFSGCTNENNNEVPADETNQDDIITDNNTVQNETNKEEVIKLNLENYREYFFLQEEIISYNSEAYIKNVDGYKLNYTRATQTTKISIAPLKQNLLFNNVGMNIWIPSRSLWQCQDGYLNISYDGTGFITLTANFDAMTASYNNVPNARFSVGGIYGSITITS